MTVVTLDRCFDELARIFDVAFLQRNNSKQMNRMRVLWLNRENLAIDVLGGIQVT